MDLNRKNVKRLRGLIIFAGVVCLMIIYIGEVAELLFMFCRILKPFLIGGAIAFVLNIPMRGIEKALFGRAKSEKAKKAGRPVSIVLAMLTVLFILGVVSVTVLPQLTKTLMDLGNKIPAFLESLLHSLEKLLAAYPELLSMLNQLDDTTINWNTILENVVTFMKSGIGSVVTSTFTVAGNIVSGVANTFISLIFSFYVLAQKEKLGSQAKRIVRAYFPAKIGGKIEKVLSLLHRNFSSFITGQCTEAVILGSMFVVSMLLLRLPYALLVGVLIAFTALIPIVGAFIGCFVGAFLILVDSPVKALIFVILFLVLQQLEGNLIYPHVVGSSVGLPSIWVLAAVTVGGSLMGILGMLIFIPILSTVYTLLREDVNNRNNTRPPEAKAEGEP